MDARRLTVARTPTGYWVVRRGSVDLSGGLTFETAEAQRALLERLSRRTERRSTAPRLGAVRLSNHNRASGSP